MVSVYRNVLSGSTDTVAFDAPVSRLVASGRWTEIAADLDAAAVAAVAALDARRDAAAHQATLIAAASNAPLSDVVLDVRDFQAVGDGTTDDRAALQAAIDAVNAASGGTLVVPGHYRVATALTLKSHVRFVGVGRNLSKITGTAGVFTWSSNITNVEWSDLWLIGGTDHVLTGTGYVSRSRINRCHLQVTANDKSILHMTAAGADWIGNVVEDTDLHRPAGATVAGWRMESTVGGANCNLFRNLWCWSNGSTAAPVFYLASTNVSNYLYDNVFEDIIGEACGGGILEAYSVNGLTLRRIVGWDQASYSRDLVKVGKTSGGVASRHVIVEGCFRRGGTLAGGVYDVNLVPADVSMSRVSNAIHAGTAPTMNLPADTIEIHNGGNALALGSAAVLSIGDATLYRGAAGELHTNSRLRTNGTGATSISYEGRVTGEADGRYFMRVNGELLWGPGTGGVDTNLYRAAANVLKTDDEFRSEGIVSSNYSGGAITQIGAVGPGGGPGLRLGGSHTLSRGAGSPEGSATAPVSSLYLRHDGGLGTSLYTKVTGSGNTGWAPVPATHEAIPADRGMLAWTYPPHVATAGAALATAGLMYLVRIRRVPPGPVTNIVTFLTGAGVTLTAGQCFAALYSAAGVLLGQTADQAAAWATPNVKTMPLAAGAYTNTVVADMYVAMWFNGTTGPAVAYSSAASSLLANIGLAAPNFAYATSDAGRTTAAPATLGTQSAFHATWWVALS